MYWNRTLEGLVCLSDYAYIGFSLKKRYFYLIINLYTINNSARGYTCIGWSRKLEGFNLDFSFKIYSMLK